VEPTIQTDAHVLEPSTDNRLTHSSQLHQPGITKKIEKIINSGVLNTNKREMADNNEIHEYIK
jgi:uncharacterized protein YfkK (UPF0435 family)